MGNSDGRSNLFGFTEGCPICVQRHAVISYDPLIKVFFQLQCYTSTIDWLDYGEARSQLESHCAQKLPNEGIAVFNKQIRSYKIALPIG